MTENSDDEKFIEFVCHERDYGVIPHPIPAARHIPEWYQRMDTTFGDGKSTVKQCRPFFDALTTGWIIPLAADIHVEAKENGDIAFDQEYDMPLLHPHAEGEMGADTPYGFSAVLQWLSPWRIRVPEGYSVLVTAPLNRRETRFSVFSGIIDYDNCFFHINSPFIWEAMPYTGTVKKGTPIIQLLPFNREGIISDGKIRKMDDEDVEEARTEKLQKERDFSRYRKDKWVPKRGSRIIEEEQV